ncbi:S-4TM family putative pore-forming effector [Mycolicibacterium llatzerense]|uniref:S-4TM family putative pore-forming effector n=1 Tax=Mycolicibacterium llatzerense TaxID=280871 RepID=UPI0021B4E0F8|nr:S-4TM family putative pore-forming effector [Mycolicibacterium llatzerense]MCT7361685.1 hypothetical protein [Mycolicibacterium llatzerense]
MTACKTHELQRRQADDDATRFLKASLHCERISLRWEYAALSTAIASAFLPILHRDLDGLKVALQFGAVALIAWFKHRSSLRRKDATILRNEFEYFVFDLFKPYPTTLDKTDVDSWSDAYDAKPTNSDVSKWFAGKCEPKSLESPPFAEQVRDAQKESMGFGSDTRRFWGRVVAAICIAIVVSYGILSNGRFTSSPAQVLSLIAGITIALQIAAIARTNFKYANSRMDLSDNIDEALIPDGLDYISVASVYQERINALRKDRPLVPKWVYLIRSSRDKPCPCAIADAADREADVG